MHFSRKRASLCFYRARIKKMTSSSSSSRENSNDAQLVECSWRVDVTLSSSQAKKVLRPTILMSLETKRKQNFSCGEEEEEEEEEEESGVTARRKRETFEMSLEMFQELRVSVAKILTEMEWANEEMKRTL